MWKAEVKDYQKLSWHLSACVEEKQWILGLLYLCIMNTERIKNQPHNYVW